MTTGRINQVTIVSDPGRVTQPEAASATQIIAMITKRQLGQTETRRQPPPLGVFFEISKEITFLEAKRVLVEAFATHMNYLASIPVASPYSF